MVVAFRKLNNRLSNDSFDWLYIYINISRKQFARLESNYAYKTAVEKTLEMLEAFD